ncbi:MAG: PHP domain-containing protein, partial [Chloroflexi bacterium]|nr:PHP domain-containing protein [Chloroflexota bacterium]
MIIDLHVHTPMGEGGGSLRSSDLIGYLERTNFVPHARAIGLDGVCLTEHDFVWPQEAIEAATKRFDFLFLRGMEVSTDYAPYGHVLA